ncbi:YjcZ family sporulation protein [Salibacterium sp. K-3]
MYQPYYGQNQVGGYSSGGYGGYGGGKAFALIVVLFILLIIVGASKTDYKD